MCCGMGDSSSPITALDSPVLGLWLQLVGAQPQQQLHQSPYHHSQSPNCDHGGWLPTDNPPSPRPEFQFQKSRPCLVLPSDSQTPAGGRRCSGDGELGFLGPPASPSWPFPSILLSASSKQRNQQSILGYISWGPLPGWGQQFRLSAEHADSPICTCIALSQRCQTYPALQTGWASLSGSAGQTWTNALWRAYRIRSIPYIMCNTS